MMNWIVGGLILLAAGLALRSVLRDRKKGGCGGCAQAGSCPYSARTRQSQGCPSAHEPQQH